jgi:hypothetical protein
MPKKLHDNQLLRAAKRLDGAVAALLASEDHPDDDIHDRLHARLVENLSRQMQAVILAPVARTIEGLEARSRALTHYVQRMVRWGVEPCDPIYSAFADSVVRDLYGLPNSFPDSFPGRRAA